MWPFVAHDPVAGGPGPAKEYRDQSHTHVSVRQEAIGVPAHVAAHRVATNDRPNAELVHLTRGKADVLLPSLPLRDSRKQPGDG